MTNFCSLDQNRASCSFTSGSGTSHERTISHSRLSRPSREDRKEGLEIAFENLVKLESSEDLSRRRYPIEFTTSLHSYSMVDAGMRIHMVLKFYFHSDIIPLVGLHQKEIDLVRDAQVGEVLGRCRGGHPKVWIPYCFFNALTEEHVSWSVQKTSANGDLYERLELYVTVEMVSFAGYFPFAMRLLAIKMGTDGSAQTDRLNLKPKLSSNGEPDWNIKCFLRDTSVYHLQPDGAKTMMILSADRKEKGAGKHFTRVYQVFYFESEAGEDLLKFVGISTVIFILFSFYPIFVNLRGEELTVDSLVSVSSTCVLSDVALLFVVPPEGGFTIAEKVIVLHCFMIVAMTAWLFCGFGDSAWELIILDALLVLATLGLVLHGYWKFLDVKNKLKEILHMDKECHACDFDEIDEII